MTPLFFEAVLNARAGERPAGVGRDRHFGPAAAGLMVLVVLARHHNVQHGAGLRVLLGLAGVGGGKRQSDRSSPERNGVPGNAETIFSNISDSKSSAQIPPFGSS